MQNNSSHAAHTDRFERRAHAMIATMEDAGESPATDRRANNRRRYLAQARLRWAEAQQEAAQVTTLYTRDLTGRGVGFITSGELPADSTAVVELPGVDGMPIQAQGKIVRTKAFANGWQEGYVRFDEPIAGLPDQPMRAA